MPKKKKMHRESIYMGVDPGKSGGVVIIWDQDNIDPYPMPTTEWDIWVLFDNLLDVNMMKAMIERVHSMPNQGVASSFTFGVGYGGLRMALTAARISFEEVSPKTWQKGLAILPRKKHTKSRKVKNRKGKWVIQKYGGETDTQWKNRLRAKAQQLFPELPVWSRTKGEQKAVCDALLIAEYCRRKDQGKL
jgi:hypothetical protein